MLPTDSKSRQHLVMPRAGEPHNEPTFKVRSLSADHPLNDDTATHMHAITRNMLVLLGRIAAVAKFASETTPSRTGGCAVRRGRDRCFGPRAPWDVLAIALDGVPGHEGRSILFE